MDERSRKRLWEDYVFHFLQKVPVEEIDAAVIRVSKLADEMLAAHDSRWKLFPEARKITLTKRPQGGKASG